MPRYWHLARVLLDAACARSALRLQWLRLYARTTNVKRPMRTSQCLSGASGLVGAHVFRYSLKGSSSINSGSLAIFPDFGREKPYQLGVAICGVKHALDGCQRLACCEGNLRVVLHQLIDASDYLQALSCNCHHGIKADIRHSFSSLRVSACWTALLTSVGMIIGRIVDEESPFSTFYVQKC